MRGKRHVVAVAVCLCAASIGVGSASAAQHDTVLVSNGLYGAAADSDSIAPAYSADGRFVAFSSDADNLDADSNDSVMDVFVRDLASNITTLVSRATGASGAVGDNDSYAPSISADGRFVAFSSDADNLDADSNDSFTDVFVRDLQANTTTLVSRATGASGLVGDGDSSRPSISADGGVVAFFSTADDLDDDSNDLVGDVFFRDLQVKVTTLVSRATGVSGAPGDDFSVFSSISADGRFVAFSSDANNLDNDSNTLVTDIFLRDLQEGITTLVSRATGVSGAVSDSFSIEPSISADGRFVAFSSDASNLDADSDASVTDVFVRDLASNITTLVSRATGASGAVGDSYSSEPSISADGRFVAFQSIAGNLDNHSNDAATDVFVRDMLGPQVPPALVAKDFSKKEGKSGTKVFTFNVKLRGVPVTPVTVDFATDDDTAMSPGDYTFTNGTLRFAPGEHLKTVTVLVNGDTVKEKDETFELLLFNAHGAPIKDDSGLGVILNDDK